jgi:GNAT superfamily N-acetyltransferase
VSGELGGNPQARGAGVEGVPSLGDVEAPAIRPAVMADAPRLAALSGALGYPTRTDALALRLGRLLERTDAVVLVAERSAGRIVGWVHGAEQDLLESERRCEILGLVVDASDRRRGAGRRLVAELERWARSRGIEWMAVRSNATRLESHPFYERLGYARVKTQHAYRKPLRACEAPMDGGL